MKNKIMISAPYLQLELEKYREELEKHFELIIPDVKERLSENDLFNIFNENNWEIDGCIVGDDQFSEKFYMFLKDKNLKCVIKWGTGIDSLNKTIAEKYNVKILNTPSAFTIPVSESTIGLMLNFCRVIDKSNRQMEEGVWSKVQGFTLNESKIGIIGLGNIGTELAHKLESFGSEISYYDPNVNNFKYKRFNILEELINYNDIITIHCDLNETSYHLINKNNIFLFSNKILLNVSRGPIINNNDLLEYLNKNNDILLGLDVFEEEPLPKTHPFRNNKNIICSSHNTNTSPKFWKNVHRNSIDMLYNEFNIKL